MKTNLATVMAALSFLMAAGISGTFFGFSVGVMPGLNAAKASSAIESMQAINDKILNPIFLGTFLLAPVAAGITGVLLLVSDQKSAGLFFLAAGVVYLLGSFLPTMIVHVPMNTDLNATAIPTDPAEATKIWTDYSSRWAPWNTLRGAFAGVSVLLMGLGSYIWGKNA